MADTANDRASATRTTWSGIEYRSGEPRQSDRSSPAPKSFQICDGEKTTPFGDPPRANQSVSHMEPKVIADIRIAPTLEIFELACRQS